jgi:rRNA-processing protein FCF1
MRTKVILDSNFLFIPSQFHVDVFKELASVLTQRFDPILLSPTRTELLRMSEKGSPKIRQQASLALKLAERCCLINVEQGLEETHDDVIVRVAENWKCPVATNDKELRKRLRIIRMPVIYLRQKSHLEVEGNIP